MRKLVLLSAFLVSLAPPLRAQSCAPARTALVLAGGGPKGFAHIGLLQVLDSIGVRPDFIVGTSAGAIIGALYASGYTGTQVDSMMRALPLSSLIGSYQPAVSSALGLLKPLAVWERGNRGYVLQSGAAREGEVNALVSALNLRGNLLARGDFDSLPIPFRAIATDIATRAPVVLDHGDLAHAVRASAAIPVVFRPVKLGGEWLTDGGVSENTPLRIARELGATRAIVSYLPWATPDPNDLDDPVTLAATVFDYLLAVDSLPERPGDVKIVHDTKWVSSLDYSLATMDSLVRLGRASARAALAKATCVRPLGGHTAPSALPATVRRVTIVGQRPADADAVLGDLGLATGVPLDLRRLERGLRKLGHAESHRGTWLNPSSEGGGSLVLGPEIDPAPTSAFGAGVAFDQFMSGRLWIGGIHRSLFHQDAEGFGLIRLGTYEQDASAFLRRRGLIGSTYVPLATGLTLSHESVRLFDGRGELPSAETREAGGFIGLKQDPATGWRGEIGLDGRLWREPGREARGAVGARASVFRARNAYEMGSIVEAVVLNDFQQLRADASADGLIGDVETRVRLRAGWGNRTPLQHTFILGGDDGFAGYRIGEMRGQQELFGSLLLRRRLNRVLRLRAEAMAGGVGRGSGFLRQEAGTYYGRIVAGVRAGVEADTPIGPIRAEEGFNTDGLRAALIRVGFWF